MIKSEDTLGIDYGCAKGERIAVPGSAVSLHAHGGWKVEKDTKGSSFG